MKRANARPRWVTLTIVFLVSVWQPATAHEWLESLGWIHGPTHGEHGVAHDAADGRCLLDHAGDDIGRPGSDVADAGTFPPATAAEPESGYSRPPARRILRLSTAPPPPRCPWQFLRRAAPPARAPSRHR